MLTPLGIDAILARLTNVKRVGDNYMATCPCHDDSTPSLGVFTGADDRPHIQCHAGCRFGDICRSLDIRFSENQFFDASDTPAKRTGGRAIEATYRYQDTFGILQFEAVRFKPKGFAQRRPDGDDWIWNLKGVRRPLPLYRLPEVLKLPTPTRIFVVEGERDVHRLVDLGLAATTTAMGAGKSKHTHLGALAGHDIVIVPDNDPGGIAHADELAAALDGKAKSVVVLRPLVDTPGGDVSDYLDGGKTVDGLNKLVDQRSTWSPSADTTQPQREVSSSFLSEIEPQDVEWLWRGRFPLAKFVIIAGVQGIGKSFLTLDMAARISTGTPWPDAQDVPIEMGTVVLLSAEDAPADTIRPRLDAAGADVRRINVVHGVPQVGDDADDEPAQFSLKDDIRLLASHVDKLGGVRLVIIDPLDAYLGQYIDSHRSGDVRRVLHPLSQFAEHHNVTVIGVAHLNKSPNPQALYRVLGSVAFTAAARAVWLVALDRDDRDRRLLLPLKMNLEKPAPGLAFKIEDTQVRWLPGDVDVTADEALGEGDDDHTPQGKVDEAAEFIRTALKDGAQRSTDILKWAKDEGISIDGALKDAKKQVGAKSKMVPGKHGKSVWFWFIPTVGVNIDAQETAPDD